MYSVAKCPRHSGRGHFESRMRSAPEREKGKQKGESSKRNGKNGYSNVLGVCKTGFHSGFANKPMNSETSKGVTVKRINGIYE